MSIYQITHDYAEYFAHLCPDNLEKLGEMLADDIVFTDPFNQITGRDDFLSVFRHMFKIMDNPRFLIGDIAASDKAGYIRWQMTGQLKSRPAFCIALEGMSEIHIDQAGLINVHLDHWDSASQLLRYIPLAGFFIRRLLRLFRHA